MNELEAMKTPASDDVIRQWMDGKKLWLRKIRKVLPGGKSADGRRREQLGEQVYFKHDLQTVVNSIDVEVRVAHYPSYCSKYNPIERRFFPYLSRACTGMLFDTLSAVVDLMRKASTSSGLRTTVNVIKRTYETGRNATEQMKESIRRAVRFETFLPTWNYTLMPQIGQSFIERSSLGTLLVRCVCD